MKKIECFIREEKLEAVIEALKEADVPGVTLTRVLGFGRQRLIEELDFKPKIKLEIYASDDELNGLLDILMQEGRIGKIGDGKIAVFEVREVLRIRTGEKNEAALH